MLQTTSHIITINH